MDKAQQAKQEERKIKFHSQNLNEGGGKWAHGRAWLHRGRRTLGVSWAHGRQADFFAISLIVRHFDDLWQIHIAIPFLFSWFLSLESGECYFDQERAISLAWHNGAIWWRMWAPVDSWSSSTPKWRDGSFHPFDFLFGRHNYSETEVINEGHVTIPMPEALYGATFREYIAQWKRARWFRVRRVRRFDIDMITGIPEPGKGENSWDLEDTALESGTYHAETLQGAIAKVIASVEQRRKRYGGEGWKPDGGA